MYNKTLSSSLSDVFEDRELRATTVVDPRFKTAPFDDEECRQHTLTYMLEAMETVATATPSSPSLSPQPTALSSVTSYALIWSKLDPNTAATAAPGRSRAAAQHELDLYIAAPAIARDQCPLRWWVANVTSYPLVAKVARRLLAIPAT